MQHYSARAALQAAVRSEAGKVVRRPSEAALAAGRGTYMGTRGVSGDMRSA